MSSGAAPGERARSGGPFTCGVRSPRPSPAARRSDEAMRADWDRWLGPADDAGLRCGGERKALELSLLADAEHARP